ncbi:MAG: hypothetical protein ACJAQ3_003743 [Planctomycetota bacterium]
MFRRGFEVGLPTALLLLVWRLSIPDGRVFNPKRGAFEPQVRAAALASAPKEADWVLARQELGAAHQLRREGQSVDAIRRYASVMNSDAARTSDRQLARAWRARLRWLRGEQSALDELQALARGRLSPQLYVHVAATLMQDGATTLGDEHAAAKRAIIAEAERALERASCVRGGSGARAKWWLDRLRKKAAAFFSP